MPTADAEPPVTIPPEVKPSINRMADKFKEAMGRTTPPKPAETKPPEPPVTVAPEPPKPAEKPAEKPAVPEFKAPEKPAATPEKPAAQIQPDAKTKIPSEQFKILEKSRDEFKDKFEATQKRVHELEAKLSVAIKSEDFDAIKNERETLLKERDSYKSIADKVAVEYTPEFKKAFTDPIARLKAEVKDAVGAEHADKIAKALKLHPEQRDAQIEAIGEELSGFKQASLIRAFTELRRKESERDAVLEKSSESKGEIEEFRIESERQRQVIDQKQVESAYAVELERANAFPEFQILEGNAEHNAVAQTNRQRAKSFLNPANANDRAKIAFWASLGVASVESSAMKDALIAKLQAQIAEMQNAAPGLAGKGGGTAAATQPGKPVGFLERFKKAQAEGIPPQE